MMFVGDVREVPFLNRTGMTNAFNFSTSMLYYFLQYSVPRT